MIHDIWKFLTPWAVWFWELLGVGCQSEIERDFATGMFVLVLVCFLGLGIMCLETIYLNYRAAKKFAKDLENERRGYKVIE